MHPEIFDSEEKEVTLVELWMKVEKRIFFQNFEKELVSLIVYFLHQENLWHSLPNITRLKKLRIKIFCLSLGW